MRVGIVCYPTWGGSGVIATEVGLAMAARGHEIHVIAKRPPVRLAPDAAVAFHPVEAAEYPLFDAAPYSLALASRIVEVARTHHLDLVHAHYAIPHATSAWMAREVLGPGAPRVVTTLHGTDITLVGADPSYLPITRHSIQQSDLVTVPSAFLRDETLRRLDLDLPIEVIPNFVDTGRYRPAESPDRPHLEAIFGPGAAEVPTVVHCSNLRPVKRVDRVVEAFARLAATGPAHLLVVGEGPDRAQAVQHLERLGLSSRARFLGEVQDLADLLRECTAFLLPSDTESFGLAALEALASGVPVVAANVGGLPEVIRDGVTGFLVDGDDLDGMAAALGRLAREPDRRTSMALAARADVLARFERTPVIDQYEAAYRLALAR